MSTTTVKDYNSLISSLIMEAITDGITSFSDLILHLPGVYPSVAIDLLSQMALEGNITHDKYRDLLYQACKPIDNKPNPSEIELPIPHPLDYDWRFNNRTSDYILRQVSSLTSTGNILFLGTPTVFRRASLTNTSRKLLLIDVNSELNTGNPTNNIQTLNLNLAFESIPRLDASAIIMDPPWYPDYFKVFFWIASQMCIVGGYLFVSMPLIGTRPGIQNENKTLIQWANTLGFKAISEHKASLTYITPPFERNALNAYGINFFPHEWRKSDLFVFRLENRYAIDRPIIPLRVLQWEEVIIANVRIRVKLKPCEGFLDPSLSSIVPGDILPSVSSRNSLRALADVWTSGNRVYACNGCQVLLNVLRAVELDINPTTFVEREVGRNLLYQEKQLVTSVTRRIKEIICVESGEYSYV